MSRFTLFLTLLSVLVFAPSWAQAQACNPRDNVCIGKPCDSNSKGATTMDNDGQNIIACLPRGVGGPLFWKLASLDNKRCDDGQMVKGVDGVVVCTDPTLDVTVSCPEGKVLKGINKGVPDCRSSGGYGGQFQIYCSTPPSCYMQKTPPASFPGCRYPNPLTGECNCPAGYTPIIYNEFESDQHYTGPNAGPGTKGMIMYVCLPTT